MHTNKGVRATFTDRFGETREIHHTRHGLTVKRQNSTVALQLNQVVAAGIGDRIRAERERQGLTLAELCIKAGLVSTTPKSRMWEIENSVRKEGVRLGTLYAIAVALGVTPMCLLPSIEEVLERASVGTATVKMLVPHD